MSGTKPQDLIFGRNPVLETLRAGRRGLKRLIIQEGLDPNPVLDEIAGRSEKHNVAIQFQPKQELDRQARNHQGVILRVGPYPYVELAEILDRAANSPEPPLLLLLDQLQDPQNFGTLLRTAEAAGVHGVLIPAHQAAGVTSAVVSASSGACEHLLIARVNLAQSMRLIKERGIWLVGLELDGQAKRIDEVDLKGPLGLVVGSEGDGLRPLVRKSCDYLIQIPMRGKLESLNAAVAGSLAIYRIWEQRGF